MKSGDQIWRPGKLATADRYPTPWTGMDIRRIGNHLILSCNQHDHAYSSIEMSRDEMNSFTFGAAHERTPARNALALLARASETHDWLWSLRLRMHALGVASNGVHQLGEQATNEAYTLGEREIGWPGAKATKRAGEGTIFHVSCGIGADPVARRPAPSLPWTVGEWVTMSADKPGAMLVAGQAMIACLKYVLVHVYHKTQAAGVESNVFTFKNLFTFKRQGVNTAGTFIRMSAFECVEHACWLSQHEIGRTYLFEPDEWLMWSMFLNREHGQ